MWTNPSSLAREQAKVFRFRPPYCANAICRWHRPEACAQPSQFIRFGVRRIARHPYVIQRFRCRTCRATFASSFFTLQYRDKKPDSYEEIHDLLLLGVSGCGIGRLLKLDEDTVRRRKKKLARWALLNWARDLERTPLLESVAYDGLENFSFSQYDINNLNHAVGRESYYVYDFNLSPMNRKGKMNPWQKERKKQLEKAFGKYDTRSIEKSSRRLFERLLAKTPSATLNLHTDNHLAYRRAIAKMRCGKVLHSRISSKVARNFHNRLFAINHTDMLSRHHLGNYKRETIAFAKNTVAMLESFVLLAVHKNYLRPRFWKPHVRDPLAHKESPAMKLNLRDKIQTFREFYCVRPCIDHVALSGDWTNLFGSFDPTSRRYIRTYAGI